MAIDPVKKVWLVCPAAHAQEVPERLARSGLVHVAEAPKGEAAEGKAAIASLGADTRSLDAAIRRLSETLAILSEFSKSARDLLSNLIATPVETTRAELAAAVEAIEVEALHEKAKALAAQRAAAQAALAKANERLAAIGAFAALAVLLPAEGALRWTRANLWLAPAKQVRRIAEGGLAPEGLTVEQLAASGNKALVATVALREDADEALHRLHELGFQPVPAPERSTTLDAHVRAIEGERAAAEGAIAAANAELAELGKLRHKVELVLGYCEGKAETARAAGKMLATGRAALLAGYVRVRDLRAFEEAVARDLPQVAAVVEDPAPGESVPVSLTNSRLVRPAQFLVEMFGLPPYSAFDPSPFLFLSFVVFYGICFGDAIYALVQFALAWALVRRFRSYPGIRSLFALLVWGAVSSFVVGVFTGTWAADLWAPADPARANAVQRLLAALTVVDPVKSPLQVLAIALLLGVANQLWGVTMKLYGMWRAGDRLGAVCDAGLWYLVLPGLAIHVAAFFAPETPRWLVQVGTLLLVVGAAGLVLTQGRNEKSLAGKAIIGLVSLYGIMGSYGCVSFIGDALSYSRLLALALTTSIVGMAVNIIGGILRTMLESPALLGTVVCVAFVVFGHLLNIVLSALGAFIHSARLIFVEFFGRFYEPGAQRFVPLGSAGGRIRVVD
ncbi:MAG: hypothetical protein FJ291_25295 [Planctomycetes bacterium]|nr:hypothetical protein [Planctomycetota bacterium]